ncbi:MAG: transglycosylase domain-containing protein, partial [bacterium]|nr:transglycosylase domain-containing protein [bacterium]
MFFKKKSSSFSAKKIAELFRKRQIRPPRAERIKSIAMKALLGMVVLGILGTLGLMIILASLEIPRLEGDAFRGVESTIIYDRAGNPLYTIHGEENRKEIPLSEIPKHVIDATLAIEDDQFYEHFGFDVGGIVKGALYEFFGIGARRGGSTITQQLVKNTLLTSERTITRKLKELVLAIQVERTYGKNEILERYLNTIPYGSNAYGVEMAAKTFFGKSAKDLSLLEAGILASLPQAPSRYNPYGNNRNLLMGSFDDEGDYIPGRKDLVLQRMETLGYISREEHQKALGESSTVEFKRMVGDITYPHFVLYVKELLENKFGKEAVETGGLRVYTTIDPTLQDKAEEVVTRWMETFPET